MSKNFEWTWTKLSVWANNGCMLPILENGNGRSKINEIIAEISPSFMFLSKLAKISLFWLYDLYNGKGVF